MLNARSGLNGHWTNYLQQSVGMLLLMEFWETAFSFSAWTVTTVGAYRVYTALSQLQEAKVH